MNRAARSDRQRQDPTGPTALGWWPHERSLLFLRFGYRWLRFGIGPARLHLCVAGVGGGQGRAVFWGGVRVRLIRWRSPVGPTAPAPAVFPGHDEPQREHQGGGQEHSAV